MTFEKDFIIYFYFTMIFLYYTSYLLLYFEILDSSKYVYFYQLNIFIQLFIALFLMIRYHPFLKKYQWNPSDGHIIFASGCFIIINLGIVHFFTEWFFKTYSKETKIDLGK